MPKARAPLFFVSLAFATGCLLAIDQVVTVRGALVLFAVAGLVWLASARRAGEEWARGFFYLLAACAGLAHALVLAHAVAWDDLRRLPEEKSLETTQWRGSIVDERVEVNPTTATGRRRSGRIACLVAVEAWRPTGGRFFDAPVETPWQPARGLVRCTVSGSTRELHLGDRIEFAGAMRPPDPPLCPGELNLPDYEAAQGIYDDCAVAALNWRVVEGGGRDWWTRLSFGARDWAYARLQLGLEDDPRMADFLAGMLIGYRQQIPADIEQDFRRTGTLHVFAVSGQNIAEMLVVAILLLQLCGFVQWRWAWTLAPVMLLYCLLTGSPASAVRATVMALVILLAWRLGRPLHALSCWSIALLAMLVWNPAILLDPGAQLSFGVVLGIILLAPPLARFFAARLVQDPFLPSRLLTPAQRIEKTLWYRFGLVLGATIAATVVSEPITFFDFHQVTPISILANLIVVPTAGIITVIGTLSVFVSLVSTMWAGWLNNANWLIAKGLIWFVALLAHEPLASWNVPDVRAMASPEPSFIVAPVQDSACLLVRTKGHAWLINSGRESPARVMTTRLLQFYGINRLDGLVLAQMSGPDNSGAEVIAQTFYPRKVIVPAVASRSPVEKIVPEVVRVGQSQLESWQAGQTLQLSPDVTVDVLNPEPEDASGRAEDRALVLLVRAQGGSLLWAGKIDASTQLRLLQKYPGLHADVLVLGPETAPSIDWLAALHARFWLQLPLRDTRLNTNPAPPVAPPGCAAWNLGQTGAVDVHFVPARADLPELIELRPWRALPEPIASPTEAFDSR